MQREGVIILQSLLFSFITYIIDYELIAFSKTHVNLNLEHVLLQKRTLKRKSFKPVVRINISRKR